MSSQSPKFLQKRHTPPYVASGTTEKQTKPHDPAQDADSPGGLRAATPPSAYGTGENAGSSGFHGNPWLDNLPSFLGPRGGLSITGPASFDNDSGGDSRRTLSFSMMRHSESEDIEMSDSDSSDGDTSDDSDGSSMKLDAFDDANADADDEDETRTEVDFDADEIRTEINVGGNYLSEFKCN